MKRFIELASRVGRNHQVGAIQISARLAGCIGADARERAVVRRNFLQFVPAVPLIWQERDRTAGTITQLMASSFWHLDQMNRSTRYVQSLSAVATRACSTTA